MKRKLLVILGPTSTGKTDLALNLAKKLNGELISADSRQVYKYLDIGTGKMPNQESRIKNKVLRRSNFWVINGVKVWMYDVITPLERFNLHEYIIKAKDYISKISDSGKFPILVGGTGLYIRSLLAGVSDFGTDKNQNLRKKLESLDIDEIRDKIKHIDPDILKKLNNSEINNKRRLIRLFEKLTGSEGEKKSFTGLSEDFDILKIGLQVQREVLNQRIKERVVKRIKLGMIDESKQLINKKILGFERMEELGLEYRYIAKFLKKEIKTQEELVEVLSVKISQFAKRQETWFKREKEVVWFDIAAPNYIKKVETLVLNWYNRSV